MLSFPSGSDDGEMICFNSTILDDSNPGNDIFFVIDVIGLRGSPTNILNPSSATITIVDDDPGEYHLYCLFSCINFF